MIGILSKIAAILADHSIPIFAVSTYNTDYFLTKKENYEKVIKALKKRWIQNNRVTAFHLLGNRVERQVQFVEHMKISVSRCVYLRDEFEFY